MRHLIAVLFLMIAGNLGCTTTASVDSAGTTRPASKDGWQSQHLPASYSVRDFGAQGDGKTLDTDAVNRAIHHANATGGGTIVFPAGNYLCYSIRLMSNVDLYLGRGCTIIAAGKPNGDGNVPGYDHPEPNPDDHWQDFGHSHFRNSLMWGDGIENVSITGPGLIWGRGLSNGWDQGKIGIPKPRATTTAATTPATTASAPPTTLAIAAVPTSKPATTTASAASTKPVDRHDARDTLVPTPDKWTYRPAKKNEYPNDDDALKNGVGNKAIALKNSRNITLRDFSVLRGGHFAFLLTGVENLTIDNIILDTCRDGMDIDNCRNVRVSNCSVNSPNDDGICLKSSYALGYLKSCEDITITNCYVTGGYREGTLLNGKRERIPENAHTGRTGRIKFGTESIGGFKRIAISNCVMEYCYGLAIESVDGATIQDVSISNIVMRDITMCPIFIRLGNRARGPDAQPGIIRRVSISNVVCSNANWRFGSIISGIPGHSIEDLTLSNIYIQQQGGGTAEEAAIRPMELEAHYPEPEMFGTMPASGFYLRHVKNVSMNDVQIAHYIPEARPLFWLEDVHGADFDNVRSKTTSKEQAFAFTNVTDFSTHRTLALPDVANIDPPDKVP